jgi:hypothetical protein
MGGQKLGGVRRPAPSKRFRRLGGLSIRDYTVRISLVRRRSGIKKACEG